MEVIYVKGDPRKHWSGWSHGPGKTLVRLESWAREDKIGFNANQLPL